MDGGGTKTLIAAAGLDGREGREARVGGSSLERRSAAEVAEELARGCGLARGDWAAEDCMAVCQFPALLPRLLTEHREAMRPILRHAADELAATLRECAAELAWSEPVGYFSGGVFTAVPELRGWVEAAWGHPLRAPQHTPVEAALAMAREAAG